MQMDSPSTAKTTTVTVEQKSYVFKNVPVEFVDDGEESEGTDATSNSLLVIKVDVNQDQFLEERFEDRESSEEKIDENNCSLTTIE